MAITQELPEAPPLDPRGPKAMGVNPGRTGGHVPLIFVEAGTQCGPNGHHPLQRFARYALFILNWGHLSNLAQCPPSTAHLGTPLKE